MIKSAALRVTTDLRAAIRGIRFTVERSTPSRDLPRVLGTRARILSTRGIPRSCVTDVITRIEAWHLHITALDQLCALAREARGLARPLAATKHAPRRDACT